MPPTTKKSFLKNEVRFYIFKEHLTKGTKILRIKSQVRAVKGIRIKHCKYMQEFVVLLQARPHCHLLNRGPFPLAFSILNFTFLNIHFWESWLFLHTSSGQSGNRTAAPLWASSTVFSGTHPPEKTKQLDGKLTPLDTDSFAHDRSWGRQSPNECEEMHTTWKTTESQGNHREETADKHLKQDTHNHESCSTTAGYQMICKSRRFRNYFSVITHKRSNF